MQNPVARILVNKLRTVRERGKNNPDPAKTWNCGIFRANRSTIKSLVYGAAVSAFGHTHKKMEALTDEPGQRSTSLVDEILLPLDLELC